MIYTKLMFRKLEALLDRFSAPFLENLKTLQTKDIIIGIAVFLVGFAAYASVSTKALINGDAAVYLQQMQNLDFAGRTVHIGYYLIGAAVIHVLPGSDDWIINLLNCSLGAISVMAIYFITLKICHRHITAVLSALLLLTHYIFLENSVYAEVYTPQVCFLLLAVLLWLLDRPILAGLSFVLSMLMTPSAVFALPVFFILRPRLRPLFFFCGTVFVIALIAILPVYNNYFFSGRGLFRAAGRSFNLQWALQKEKGEILSSFLLCTPLLALGMFALFKQKNFRPFGIALLGLWAVTLFLAEKFGDVPPQLPTYALLCVAAGAGLDMLLRIAETKKYALLLSGIIFSAAIASAVLIKLTKPPSQIATLLPKWFLPATAVFAFACLLACIPAGSHRRRALITLIAAAIFALGINAYTAFAKIRIMNRYHTGYRTSVIEMSKIAQPGYLTIGNWSRGILFEHYVFQKSYTPYWINTEWLAGAWGTKRQTESIEKLNHTVATRRQIWLLGNHPELSAFLQQNGYNVAPFRFIYVATAKQRM